MVAFMSFRFFILVLIPLISACNSVRVSPIKTQFKGLSPQDLYSVVCSVGQNLHSVSGEASVKIKSKEVSGQFQAHIQAEAPQNLFLEVDHPFKGVVAQVSIKNEIYEIKSFNEDPPFTERGLRTWNGVPLELVHALFFGKIPCPKTSEFVDLGISSQGELRVREKNQNQWTYEFKIWNDKPWPDRVIFENLKGKSQKIEMLLDDPDSKHGTPLKWEIHSYEGFIKVRWKERASD